MKKQSIRIQFATTAIVLIAATILICLLMNMLFLEQVYTRDKKQSLIETYELLQGNSARDTLTSEAFMITLDNACGRYNLNMIILDERNYPVLYSAMDLESLSSKLIRYQWGYYAVNEVLETTNNYMIQTSVDSRSKTEKMEMWGRLDNGYTFLFSTPLESIEESAAISNKFMAAIGLLAMILGGVSAWIYSGQISKPILALADLSEKITQLDFETKYTGTEKNEIGILGNNMNSLSDSLKNTISELKTANIELQQDIQRKEEIDAMRQEFIGNVSHELKTPIALIQGYAEGLKEGITEEPENVDYYLEVIHDEANRMNRMVKSLLTLSELESGNPRVAMERFDLVALVRNYINSADVLLKEKDVRLSLMCPECLYVWGDEFKTEEVVMNYFTNAVHYVDYPPVVSKNEEAGVKPFEKEICVTVEQAGDNARVTVFNTGANIPEEDLSHIWEKFYKVDKARTRAYGGSGIGLSIVKAIMNSMNQKYGVNNVENGVAFWFELDIK